MVKTREYENATNALRGFNMFAKRASKIGTLTEADINLCNTAILDLVSLLKLTKIRSCKIKIHIMMKHLIPFMRKNKCLASMCEEGLESIHSQFYQFGRNVKRGNKLNQVLICTQNHAEKVMLFDESLL